MSHLDDTRLLELSLDDARPTAEESAHLECCEACATRLAEESVLSAGLAELELPEVPPGFTAATTQRFVRARGVKRARRVWPALLASLVAGYVLALPLMLAALQGLGELIKELALLLADIATWANATVTLFLGTPSMALISLIALAAVMLFWTGILARLGRQSAVEITGAVGS